MTKAKDFPFTAGIALAVAFTFSCSGDDGDVNSQSYGYCLFSENEMCLDGPFALNDCNSIGGKPSNNCPYGSAPSPSSSSVMPSSSSVAQSSSSVEPSSSSALPSSSSFSGVVYGTPVTYGDEVYRTVVIGTQKWFAKNLNYDPGTGTSVCNDCAIYGRLYNWYTAMEACPDGWHLPTQEEWDELLSYVSSDSGCYINSCAATLLKAMNGWHNGGTGTDKYGFSALPGYSDNPYTVDRDGNWWSASGDAYAAFYLMMKYDFAKAGWNSQYKSELFSVRCLED